MAKDYNKAFNLFKSSAEQRYDKVKYNLGAMYENGAGVEQDLAKAMEWYKKASNQGGVITQKY